VARSNVDERRAKVTAIALALPEATASSRTGQHSAFEVRGKKFAYYLVDHHGDGRVAINCKAPPGAQSSLVSSDPAKFFVPAYLGAKGWIGIDLDAGKTDWDEIASFVRESYRMIAPKRLAALLEDEG
jgi:phosphoribosylglycinamide formyltransferase-1